jgi:hypothetical protein
MCVRTWRAWAEGDRFWRTVAHDYGAVSHPCSRFLHVLPPCLPLPDRPCSVEMHGGAQCAAAGGMMREATMVSSGDVGSAFRARSARDQGQGFPVDETYCA